MPRRKPAERVIELIAASPWYITEPALQNILAIANRTNLSPEVLEAQLGHKLDNTHAVTIRDGIATIPVNGPIFRRADFFTRCSGATVYEQLATDLNTAIENPNVRAIILAIDSPGSEVRGTEEFAELLFQARGKKPLVAHVDGEGCSGAYWLASAAESVFAVQTAIIGSVGVVLDVYDFKEADAKLGIRRVKIRATQSPKKQPDATEEGGRAQLQNTIDSLADVFIETVARNRGVTAKVVEADFGQGDVFVGQKAVDAGLVDGIATFEEVHAAMVAHVQSGRPTPLLINANGGRTMSNKNSDPARAAAAEGDEPDPMCTCGHAKSAHADGGCSGGDCSCTGYEAKPDAAAAASAPSPAAPASAPAPKATTFAAIPAGPVAVADLADAGKDKESAVVAERNRILGIQALSVPGREALIKACVEDPTCTVEMAALKVLEADKTARASGLAAIKKDEANTPAPGPLAPGAGDTPASRGQTMATQYLALTGRAPAQRA